MTTDSTQHASPGNGVANQAGSFCISMKPPLSRENQLSLMQRRGLVVDDRDAALELLSEVNYYRLRGYWLTYWEDGAFKPGTTFELIQDTYRLDQELRHWLWQAIEPIEIKARTSFAYHVSMTCGACAYRDSSFFKSRTDHEKSLANIQREIDLAYADGVPCVKHNMDKYGELPLWAAVEVTTLGTLSRLYGNLKSSAASASHKDPRKLIAAEFGTKPETLKSWLRHLTYIRNICGHHNRFYNRMITMQPKLLRCDAKYSSKKEFPTFLVLMRLYEGQWNAEWKELMSGLDRILAAHTYVPIEPMGFPKDWKNILS